MLGEHPERTLPQKMAKWGGGGLGFGRFEHRPREQGGLLVVWVEGVEGYGVMESALDLETCRKRTLNVSAPQKKFRKQRKNAELLTK